MPVLIRFGSVVFLFAILIAAIGCGSSSQSSQSSSSKSAPTIVLTAQPTMITSGSSTTLNWNASNATSVTIAGVGTFAATGSVKVTPSSTTTYTATATGPGGSAKSSVNIAVISPGAVPTIAFSAQPSSVSSGASAVLSWTTKNAISVTIANVGSFGASGSATVKPVATTTYSATASGPAGTAVASTVVTVNGGAPPPTIALSAQPSTIINGNSAVLSWTSTNATSVTIAGVGTFGASGSTNVSPAATTTYTATATGAGGSANSSLTVTVQPGVPQFGHVFLLMEENHSYSDVIGSSSMPYFNSLAQQYGLATQYFANTHPSIGNYFMLTTGQIITNDDYYIGTVSDDNFVRHFISAGTTWKSYAEDLPSVGYIGGDTGNYMQHHNPFTYFTDVVNSQTELNNLVPFTQFATDLANNQLPQFSYIVPNIQDDAHNGTLAQADSWLSTNIAPLIASSTFQQDGLLIITFDESVDSDTAHGGGQVAMIVISPKVKKAYQSTTLYQHQSTCELILQALGETSFPGACQGAPQMSEFF
jgi:phosphatidylinositol-3-phosphatase